MATTVLTPLESFLYPLERTRISVFNFYFSIEDMDRFYPSKQQQDCWSRNFRWPPRSVETSLSTSQTSTATVPSVYSTCISNEGTKVSFSSCSRNKPGRDHFNRRDSPCGQGITLRPEDLLITNDNRLPLSPYSVFEWSNSLVPNASSRLNPSAYLRPDVEDSRQAHGSRRFELGGSASELHSTVSEIQLARRRSEGNYEHQNNVVSRNAETRLEAPRATGCPPPARHVAAKKLPLRAQDSLDASDSSLSSSFKGRTTANGGQVILRRKHDRTAPYSGYTASGAAPDGDTFSSNSSTSGLDNNAPSTTTSSSHASSSSSSSSAGGNHEESDDSTKRCCYCRLGTSESDSSSSDVCCCSSHVAESTCSCCCSLRIPDVETRRRTLVRVYEKDLHRVPRDQRNSPSYHQRNSKVTNHSPESQRKLRHALRRHQQASPRSRSIARTKDAVYGEQGSKSPKNYSPNTIRRGSKVVDPSSYRQERQSPVFPMLINIDDKTSKGRRNSRRGSVVCVSCQQQQEQQYPRHNQHHHHHHDVHSLGPFDGSVLNRGSNTSSPRRRSSADLRETRSPVRTPHQREIPWREAHHYRRKGQITGEDDGINLRVYSPNPLSRRNTLADNFSYRTRSLQRLDSDVDYPNSRDGEAKWDMTRRRRKSYKSSLSVSNIDGGAHQKGYVDDNRQRISTEQSEYNVERSSGTEKNVGDKKDGPLAESFSDDHQKSRRNSCHKLNRVRSVGTDHEPRSRNYAEPEQHYNVLERSPRRRRSENSKKASKILHTKVTLVKREPNVGSKTFKANQISDEPGVGEANIKPSRTKPFQTEATSTFEGDEISGFEPGKSNFVVIDVPDETQYQDEPDGVSCSSKTTVRTAVATPSSSSSRSETISIDMTNDLTNTRGSDDVKEYSMGYVEPGYKPSTAESTSGARSRVSEEDFAPNVAAERRGRNRSISVEVYPRVMKSNRRVTTKQMSEDILCGTLAYEEDFNVALKVHPCSAPAKIANTDPVLNNDDECACSSSTCLGSENSGMMSVGGENASLSEEECTLCRKEKDQKRALSPKVLIMRASPTKELEEPVELTERERRRRNSASPKPGGSRENIVAVSKCKSLTPEGGTTPLPKPKTPEFLTADFPFEPEIVRKANPLVDEAEDEACDRKLGSPFRRLSEEEFIATLSIHEAAGKGDLHVIKLLVKKDSKQMETVDERGWTPIHIAAAQGHVDIVKYLSQEGAHLAALDPSSYTAIHLAAMNGHNNCVEPLLHMGVDVDCVTSEGFTPLHLAAMNGHLECCQTLLYWGGSLEKTDALGRRVQDMVEEYGLCDVNELISRFQRQLKKFHDILRIIQPEHSSENWGDSLMASLSRLKESEISKDILDMLTSLSEDSGPE